MKLFSIMPSPAFMYLTLVDILFKYLSSFFICAHQITSHLFIWSSLVSTLTFRGKASSSMSRLCTLIRLVWLFITIISFVIICVHWFHYLIDCEPLQIFADILTILKLMIIVAFSSVHNPQYLMATFMWCHF